MAQIKETIEKLCNILRGNGTIKIKPETFRLAKFDNDACVDVWWRLLYDLLYFCKHGRIDKEADDHAKHLSKVELGEYVKRELYDRGMLSPELCALDPDSSHGSRELLIAFGWLLSTEAVIERFMRCPGVNFCETSIYSHKENECQSSSCRAMSLPSDFKPEVDPVTNVKQLLLFRGKLDHSLRGMHALQRQRSKLHHRMAKSTYGVSVDPGKDHLSPSQINLLRNPQALEEAMAALEKDNDRLQNLLSWKKHEDAFWSWMLTVLELKAKLSTDHPTTTTPITVTKTSMEDMQKSQRELHETIVKYEKIIDDLEHIWQSKAYMT